MNKKNILCDSNSTIFSTDENIVMGILNVTNDSFFDGGKYNKEEKIILQCKKMLDEGASIIDVGAQSSRPGANQISSEEEQKVVIPTIKLLKKHFNNIVISVDTFWADTAIKSIETGANIINDISAGEIDKNMFTTIAKLNIPYIMMHMKGIPKNMQKNPLYQNVILEIIKYFNDKIIELNTLGFHKITIDPGFGFGKNIEDNYRILNNLDKFKILKTPILVGTSRKSMIYSLLDTTPQKALNGTSVINTIALNNGAKILRVHDVKEAMECIKITNFAKNHY